MITFRMKWFLIILLISFSLFASANAWKANSFSEVCRLIEPLTDSLFKAIQQNDVEQVKALLEKGANPNVIIIDRSTPLHWALQFDNEELVKLLVRKGADVNATTDDGETPLMMAAWGQPVEILQLLIDNGAKTDVCDQRGRTPLLMALSDNDENARLLIQAGASVAFAEEKAEISLLGTREGMLSSEMWKLLIEHGASISYDSGNGYTALHGAILHQDLSLVTLIVEKGAEINAQNAQGETPLHLAVYEADYDKKVQKMAMYLLTRGADPNINDKTGTTPLNLAEEFEMHDLVRSMKEQ